jgi:acetyl esterase/lipase
MASKKNNSNNSKILKEKRIHMPHSKVIVYLLSFVFAFSSPSNAESQWQKQQDHSRKQTEKYLQKNLTITSERFVFKTITLPDGKQLELDMQIERPKAPGLYPVVFFVHGGGWITGSKDHFCHQSFELAKNGIAGVRIEYRLMEHGGTYSNVIGDISLLN